MATFDPATDAATDVAFRLLRTSPVTLFWRRPVLEQTVAWLVAHDYQVVRLDATSWATAADLHENIAAALNFPGYYGNNLDALNDCLRDVVDQDYGWTPGTAGLVVVFTGYDGFAECCPSEAQEVLDILADHSRRATLIGRRLLCLVQSNDPQISFEPVGRVPVTWNDAEWLASKRRP